MICCQSSDHIDAIHQCIVKHRNVIVTNVDTTQLRDFYSGGRLNVSRPDVPDL